jgi:hypothetical protein
VKLLKAIVMVKKVTLSWRISVRKRHYSAMLWHRWAECVGICMLDRLLMIAVVERVTELIRVSRRLDAGVLWHRNSRIALIMVIQKVGIVPERSVRMNRGLREVIRVPS